MLVLGGILGVDQQSTATLCGITFLDLQQQFDEILAWDRRYYMKGLFFREIDAAAIERMVDCIAKASTPEAEFYVLQLGGAVCDIDDEATAYGSRWKRRRWYELW